MASDGRAPGRMRMEDGAAPGSTARRLSRLKAWAVVTSIGALGGLLGLAGLHVTGVTARADATSGASAPDFRAAENAFFGGGFGGESGFGFGSGGGAGGQRGAAAPAAATTVS